MIYKHYAMFIPPKQTNKIVNEYPLRSYFMTYKFKYGKIFHTKKNITLEIVDWFSGKCSLKRIVSVTQ